MAQANYPANKLSIIDSLPLFSDLSFLQKHFISSRSQIIEFKKGEIIYREGDHPDYFYCVVTGRVEIYHPVNKTKNHKELVIECVRKGEYFGSISSLTGQSHTVSTRVLNDSVLLRISRGNFNHILRKIPKLAIFLSHSLSRRLGRKTLKEIFESKIIAVCGVNGGVHSSSYAAALEANLSKEAGKKVLIVRSVSISNKREVPSKLSLFTADYHYVLVDVQGPSSDVDFEVLRQADITHIISPSDKESLHKASLLVKRLEGSQSRHVRQVVSVIVKEDSFYRRTSYADKVRILSKNIFASLPEGGPDYRKTVRRIARQISGVMVGLALGSGAAMGFAHIGVLEVLEEKKVPVDIISATSIGALIAAFWAAGFTAGEIAKVAQGFKSRLKTLLLADPTIPLRGLIKGRAVRKFLNAYLGNKTFFDIKVPLKIVACDIKNRREFIIDEGKLVDAVMASIAIPGVFEPVEFSGGIKLVDGGIVNPVPVSVLSRLGINRIIAVNTLPAPEDMVRLARRRLNIYDVIVNSFQAMEYTIAQYSCQQADVYLHPIPKLGDWYEFYKAHLFIKSGRDHAREALPKIKQLMQVRY